MVPLLETLMAPQEALLPLEGILVPLEEQEAGVPLGLAGWGSLGLLLQEALLEEAQEECTQVIVEGVPVVRLKGVKEVEVLEQVVHTVLDLMVIVMAAVAAAVAGPPVEVAMVLAAE